MEKHPERRDSRRIIVGPDYSIRFVAKGRVFNNVRLTNLSAGGCFAVVGRGDSAIFTQGTILEQLGLEHPDLKAEGITAEVRYVLGGAGPDSFFDFTGLGVQFVSIPTAAKESLDAFVTRSNNLPGA
jgi:c-di-GMP-binding flagellar brake protein YcgR